MPGLSTLPFDLLQAWLKIDCGGWPVGYARYHTDHPGFDVQS